MKPEKVSKERLPIGFGSKILHCRALGMPKSTAYALERLVRGLIVTRGYTGASSYLEGVQAHMKACLYNLDTPETDVWISTINGWPSKVIRLKKNKRLARRLCGLKRLLQAPKSLTRKLSTKWWKAVNRPAVNPKVKAAVACLCEEGARYLKTSVRYHREGLYPERTGSTYQQYFLKMLAKNPPNKGEMYNCTAAIAYATYHALNDMCHVALTELASNRWIQATFNEFNLEDSRASFPENPLWNILNLLANSPDFSFRDHCLSADHYVGKIFSTMEPGVKLRVFAAPRLVYQAALKPLADYLNNVLLEIGMDCTHSQESGALFVQEALSEGKTVWSYDLSSATDNAPREIQFFILKLFNIPSDLLRVFEYVSQGEWILPDEFGRGGQATWSVGQPLGTIPSFATFALWHHTLICGICRRLNVDPKITYRVLGDDVVIIDKKVAEEYKRVISSLGIPISLNKSYTSDNYAEFAGYHISKDTLVRPGKFKDITPSSLMSKLRDPDYTKRSFLLPRYARKLLNQLENELEPLGFKRCTDWDLFNASEDWKVNTWTKMMQSLGGDAFLVSPFIRKLMWSEFPTGVLQANKNGFDRYTDALKQSLLTLYVQPEVLPNPEFYETAKGMSTTQWSIYESIGTRLKQLLFLDLPVSEWVLRDSWYAELVKNPDTTTVMALCRMVLEKSPYFQVPDLYGGLNGVTKKLRAVSQNGDVIPTYTSLQRYLRTAHRISWDRNCPKD